MRGLCLAVALGFCAAAAPAWAGGRATCATGYDLSYDAQGMAVCVQQRAAAQTGGVVERLRLRRPAQERRFGIFCGYPHRPSDTVFSGGSGYLIKDDVRRRQGCL